MLAEVSPTLQRMLTWGEDAPPLFKVSDIRCETVFVQMRDGARLATDLYRPPLAKAPAIIMRLPYGRSADKLVGTFMAFARRGYIVLAQDCRGTGASEPDFWDYYMYEPDDGFDIVEWASGQDWFDGFVGACGGSYGGQTQWPLAIHPKMSTIVPEVSGIGAAQTMARFHMTLNAYARSVGKGPAKLPVHYTELERHIIEETWATGFFNDPIHPEFSAWLLDSFPELNGLSAAEARKWLWCHYCGLSCEQRAAFVRRILQSDQISVVEVEKLSAIFGSRIPHDAHSLPFVTPGYLCASLKAAPLMITGWYDWALNDALLTWESIQNHASPSVRALSRLILSPAAHNVPGYHEGIESYPELQHNHRVVNHIGLLLHWYAAVREASTEAWPKVIYYLMGANEWHVASNWPPPERTMLNLYLGGEGRLYGQPVPDEIAPTQYIYDPVSPTPTVGGSIVSTVYPPGSVDVSEVQLRSDVVTYSSRILPSDLDVVGPLRVTLYAASTASDTDFFVRLSDVFPDGRAIQLQSGLIRARYRDEETSLMTPGEIYCFDIDLWATANRFRAGHRVRLDISSSDFPRYERNTNLGGEIGSPVPANQTIFHDATRPSHLSLSILGPVPESWL